MEASKKEDVCATAAATVSAVNEVSIHSLHFCRERVLTLSLCRVSNSVALNWKNNWQWREKHERYEKK